MVLLLTETCFKTKAATSTKVFLIAVNMAFETDISASNQEKTGAP
jgi:hypothetical protein